MTTLSPGLTVSLNPATSVNGLAGFVGNPSYRNQPVAPLPIKANWDTRVADSLSKRDARTHSSPISICDAPTCKTRDAIRSNDVAHVLTGATLDLFITKLFVNVENSAAIAKIAAITSELRSVLNKYRLACPIRNASSARRRSPRSMTRSIRLSTSWPPNSSRQTSERPAADPPVRRKFKAPGQSTMFDKVFGLKAETVFFDYDVLKCVSVKHLITTLHVGQIEVRHHVRQ